MMWEKLPFSNDIERYWQLLSVLVPQNLNTRYRGSFLGVYWSLLNPIIMTTLYTVIFGTTFASYFGDSIINYMFAAFTGLLVINFYNSATTQALSSIVINGDLLNKIKLPLPVFPLSMIAANIFQFIVGSLPLLIIVTLIKTHNILFVFSLLLPFSALVLVCTGIGLFLSALFVFFRDLGYFYEIATFIVWITSPVFYPSEIVPARVQPFLYLNPLVPIIESLRQISLDGTFPEFSHLMKGFLSGIVILTLGCLFFRKVQSSFMDLL
ncbi:ABC transporter permease [Geminocystis sp. GBBB08]|uniref:ABC transporter permease n=1 Tax=Geminocystis sp. GBBB08 TaxID=2604140 RepID=UPI0027E39B07|nr:ABC transporter permease [Geminocystis sp. GBBB08]